ncbi:3-oxoacyl-[acyl-carrier-protein] synthase 2 [Streptomyces spiroverticillatus]|uniref:3-oxoacyl-[acyl-carrier-protein] synthase 2 n=1 Tax=Streptomyces finlayi TaxID=67296 RepID=A0A918X5V9_9ACTN|nr:beta-ketoacyl synthase N-terminal-like domain-containing protein [Streptomyces finlayi]GHA36078.1 3-oxoacyl-[acyl-carrier-protein] synthase 2 [Streptomyces spiroverticillatus]GHD12458.1 3-oxoacyl-[acyl-carrier-protein] synthase 2 [Streptomyces finlayi]
MRDIVISGIGLATAFGNGTAAFSQGLAERRCALERARRFRAASYRGHAVGEVSGETPAGGPRRQAYMLAAVEEALQAARLTGLPEGSQVILVGQSPLPKTLDGVDADQREFMGPTRSGALGTGSALYITQACASTLFAVSLAREILRSGNAPAVVVAGGTALNPYEYASLDVVRALSMEPARPFDVDRQGISLGEGGGALVLEDAGQARRRGANADLAVAGLACRLSAGKAVASDTDAISTCMRAAMADAGVSDLDYLHAHATGTQQGDAAELQAAEQICAENGLARLPMSSHKGAIGHLLHISGVAAIAATATALRTGTVPPTVGLSAPEASSRVVLPAEAQRGHRLSHAAVNSFGFGGNNACLILSRT